MGERRISLPEPKEPNPGREGRHLPGLDAQDRAEREVIKSRGRNGLEKRGTTQSFATCP